MNRQIIRAALLLAAGILVLVEIPLGVNYSNRARDRLLTEIERDARVLAALIEQELVSEDLSSVSRITDRYAERTSGRVIVTDLDGIAVVDTANDRALTDDFSDRPEVTAALAGSQDAGIAQSDALGDEFGYVAVPIFSNAEIIGAMRLSEPTTEMRGLIRRTWVLLGGLAVAVLSAAAVGAWLIGRWATSPVLALERAAGRLADGDLSERTDVRGGPLELRRLSRTFDDMAARLQVLVASQQKFVADASHQLRTPLTALRLRIESVEDRMRADPTVLADGPRSAMERDLEAAGAEVERLTGLVDRLLALARAEGATSTREIDLVASAREAIDRWVPLAEAQDVSIRYRGADTALVREASGATAQMLDNLIDNAITASPPGSTIEVSVIRGERPGAFTSLSVRDRGPGLTDDELARAADRFWRAPGAPPGGSGLGLAIVSELAAVSNGGLRLVRSQGGGLVATVDLPSIRPETA